MSDLTITSLNESFARLQVEDKAVASYENSMQVQIQLDEKLRVEQCSALACLGASAQIQVPSEIVQLFLTKLNFQELGKVTLCTRQSFHDRVQLIAISEKIVLDLALKRAIGSEKSVLSLKVIEAARTSTITTISLSALHLNAHDAFISVERLSKFIKYFPSTQVLKFEGCNNYATSRVFVPIVAHCKSLRQFTLNNWTLSDKSFQSLSGLSSLQHLDFKNSKYISKGIPNLTLLKDQLLHVGCPIGSIFDQLSNFPLLRSLSLVENISSFFADEHVDEILKIPSLKIFKLACDWIHDTGQQSASAIDKLLSVGTLEEVTLTRVSNISPVMVQRWLHNPYLKKLTFKYCQNFDKQTEQYVQKKFPLKKICFISRNELPTIIPSTITFLDIPHMQSSEIVQTWQPNK